MPADEPPNFVSSSQSWPIWHKYVMIAEKWDQQLANQWKQSMNNLLIFVRSPIGSTVYDPNASEGGIIHRDCHFIFYRRDVFPQ